MVFAKFVFMVSRRRVLYIIIILLIIIVIIITPFLNVDLDDMLVPMVLEHCQVEFLSTFVDVTYFCT